MTTEERGDCLSDKHVASSILEESLASSIKTITHNKAKTVVSAKPTRKLKAKKLSLKDNKPKRPLSAYNIFFQSQRKLLLHKARNVSHGLSRTPEMSFAGMARHVAGKWNILDASDRRPFVELAIKEKARYQASVAKWKTLQNRHASEEMYTYAPQTEEKESSAPSLGSLELLVADSTDSFMTSKLAHSDMLTLTSRVLEDAKMALYTPIIQKLRNSSCKETRDLFAHQDGHYLLGLDFKASSCVCVSPIQQEEQRLDICKVEWDPHGRGTHTKMITESVGIFSMLELSKDDFSYLANFLAAGCPSEEEDLCQEHTSYSDQLLPLLPQSA